MIRELNYTELRRSFAAEEVCAASSEAPLSSDLIIGQDRATRALNFGLSIKAKGYNIFVSGPPGTGKTTFAKRYAQEQALSEPPPPDMCYVYNFKEPMYPHLLTFKNGGGRVFKDDMEELVALLSAEMQRIFSGKDFDTQKKQIVDSYKEKSNLMIREITEDAESKSFGVRTGTSGMYFLPRIDGELVTEEQFEELDEKLKKEISEKSEIIQERATEVMDAIRQLDRDTRKDIEDLQYSTGLFTVGYHINRLLEKYQEHYEVIDYLNQVKEDILDNLSDFWTDNDSEEEESLMSLLPWAGKKNKVDALSKYKVNLIVDNSNLSCAPVVVGTNPTYTSLVGEIEYDSEFGNLVTDFMKIKSGLLHKANGGYLILPAYDVLTISHSWETLRKAIKNGEVTIEPLREYSTGLSMTSVRPQNAPINVKIILIGTQYYYSVLRAYDDEFQRMFKITAAFDYELKCSNENVRAIAQFIDKYAVDTGSLPYSSSAVAQILEHSVRMAENQHKLTAQFGKLTEILTESAEWARIEGADTVTGIHVKKAIAEREYRCNLYEEKMDESYADNMVMLDTVGKKVGQINGLAVLDTGDYVFAKPTRITATTYLGKAGIVNVEKEAELSGEIHDKGVQILIGYLGQTYAQDHPLTLSCRICFEQNYNGIDGDSASSTELYAVLSSLSGLPINQELAVTGSINQRGEIQAIGGVTYKIEGFFNLCKQRGLTGTQGVIIPTQNTKDLVLKEEVVEAVKNGLFHIFAIKHVDEGLELLTGTSAGKRNARGKFPTRSVHGLVTKKLKDYFEKSNME